MADSEECAGREQRRRRLIERLNQQEEGLLRRERSTRRVQMSAEKLEAEIDRECHDWRNQFGPGGAGV
jgi:hypothetical protein